MPLTQVRTDAYGASPLTVEPVGYAQTWRVSFHFQLPHDDIAAAVKQILDSRLAKAQELAAANPDIQDYLAALRDFHAATAKIKELESAVAVAEDSDSVDNLLARDAELRIAHHRLQRTQAVAMKAELKAADAAAQAARQGEIFAEKTALELFANVQAVAAAIPQEQAIQAVIGHRALAELAQFHLHGRLSRTAVVPELNQAPRVAPKLHRPQEGAA